MCIIDKTLEVKIQEDNYKIFDLTSKYLNYEPNFITKEKIEEILKCGVSTEYAFITLLTAYFGLDVTKNIQDKDLFNNYLSKMVYQLDASVYYTNPYYKNIKIPNVKIGNCKLKYGKYEAFEGFVCNDIIRIKDGRQIPQLGFFETKFLYPAIYENNRLWMSVTPNEIETMKEPVYKAFGDILTFGLGLGYYAYMVSEKSNVNSVTIVENNDNIIKLFEKYILPQFENAQKIKIINADAFEYAEKYMSNQIYDFVFVDLWHDVSDGIEMYLKMKEYETKNPDTEFTYWIEKSIQCYL